MTEQSKLELYNRQKKLLDTFLSTGAISKAQYNKSLGDLTEKMDIGSTIDNRNNMNGGETQDEENSCN